MGYHVLAFDYRGYGDSSLLSPNEQTMTKDLQTAIRYARSAKFPHKKKNVVVIVHGHSLGTGVAVKAGANMAGDRHRPDGYILEAAFNNMKDEVG